MKLFNFSLFFAPPPLHKSESKINSLQYSFVSSTYFSFLSHALVDSSSLLFLVPDLVKLDPSQNLFPHYSHILRRPSFPITAKIPKNMKRVETPTAGPSFST